MRSMVSIGGALAAMGLLALTACGGGGGAAPAPPTAPSTGGLAPPAAGASPASGTVAVPYASSLLAGAQYVGPASFARRTVFVVMGPSNLAALRAAAAAVNDPSSPSFHQFLNPQQIGDAFGAPASTYTAAQQYFQKFGLSTAAWTQRFELAVSGTQPQLQAALGATFGQYRNSANTFVALNSAPHLPATLHAVKIQNLVDMEPDFAAPPNPVGAVSTLGQSLSPQQIQTALDFVGPYSVGLNGQGVTVAVIATGQTNAADVVALSKRYGVPVGKLNYAPVSGPGAVAPPTTSPYSSYLGDTNCQGDSKGDFTVSPPCIADEEEAQIDSQTIMTLAPGANFLLYLSYAGTSDPGAFANTETELAQAVSDNKADVVSMSFGECEAAAALDTGNGNTTMASIAALALEGVSVFASSGDEGVWQQKANNPNYGFSVCPGGYAANVGYPASDPAVAAVGAVYLPVNSAGTLIGAIVPWGYQDTNGSNNKNSAGSGGGYSSLFPEPASQNVVQPPINPSAGGRRMLPDIMMGGDPRSAFPLLGYVGSGLGGPIYEGGAGTSEATPQAAAAWAIVLQACRASAACTPTLSYNRIGDPKNMFYGIYSGQGPYAGKNKLAYGNVFYDVTYGNNTVTPGSPATPAPSASPLPTPIPPFVYGYNAGPGYDLASGIGVPYVGPLVRAVTGMQNVP